MAEKRMFSKKIIDTDWFMEMPASSQNLYFHLSMRADDDGFVASPKRIIKLVGASDDDYKVLIAKKFIIPFDSGVCVISDWRINNYLRNDRYTETIYQNEMKSLIVDESGKYNLGIPDGIPVVSSVLSNTNSNSLSISSNIKEEKHKYGEYHKVLLKDSEIEKLKTDYPEDKFPSYKDLIKYLDEYIEMKGYKAKSHYLVIKKWVVDACKRGSYGYSTRPQEKKQDNVMDILKDLHDKYKEEDVCL